MLWPGPGGDPGDHGGGGRAVTTGQEHHLRESQGHHTGRATDRTHRVLIQTNQRWLSLQPFTVQMIPSQIVSRYTRARFNFCHLVLCDVVLQFAYLELIAMYYFIVILPLNGDQCIILASPGEHWCYHNNLEHFWKKPVPVSVKVNCESWEDLKTMIKSFMKLWFRERARWDTKQANHCNQSSEVFL